MERVSSTGSKGTRMLHIGALIVGVVLIAGSAPAQTPCDIQTRIAPFLDEVAETQLLPLADTLIAALVATEDAGFYNDFPDGSPITRILAHIATAELEQSCGVPRLEIMLIAVAIANTLDRDIILSAVLQRSYFGNGCIGAAAASTAFFQTSAANLTKSEAIALIALMPSPHAYIRDPAALTERMNYVVDRMTRAGYLTSAEAAAIDLTQIPARVAAGFCDGL